MNGAESPLNVLLISLFNVQNDAEILWVLIKIMFLVAFFMYFLFSLIVVRQVFIMTSTFKTPAAPMLKLFAFVHLFFAVGIVIAAYLIL